MIPIRVPRAAVAASAAVAAASIWALAGPLDPPDGPIAPTFKTLTEVEPRTALSPENTPGDANSVFRITKPGSYYLTGNVSVPQGKHGIEVAVSRVTIDLRGFEVAGNAGSKSGITPDGVQGLINISVENGGVRNLDDKGIDLATVDNARIVNIRCNSNKGLGISAGNNSLIGECVIATNSGLGISGAMGDTLVIERCRIEGNTSGVYAAGNIRDTLIVDNLGEGVQLYSGTVTGCISRGNGSNGFYVWGKATIADCTSVDNGGVGIATFERGVVIRGCTITGNRQGAQLSASLMTDCIVDSSQEVGVVSWGSTITNCTVLSSGLHGIQVFSSSLVQGCTVSFNGDNGVGAGILVEGSGVRIDGNNLVGNDYGVRVPGSDNVIVRNTARDNSLGNYTFPGANNDYGQIITNAGANFTSSNPWANFQY